jgi:antitoxin MazE
MQRTTRVKRRSAVSDRRSAARTDAPSPRSYSTLSRWGNSLGLRILQEAANRLNLKPGTRVSVELDVDSITIRRIRAGRKRTAADLFKGVKPNMVGGEVDWGPPVGKEVW